MRAAQSLPLPATVAVVLQLRNPAEGYLDCQRRAREADVWAAKGLEHVKEQSSGAVIGRRQSGAAGPERVEAYGSDSGILKPG